MSNNSNRNGAPGPNDRGARKAARGYRWRNDFPDASPEAVLSRERSRADEPTAPPPMPWLIAHAAGRRWRLELLAAEPGDDGRYWRAVEDRLEPGPELRAIVAELDDPDRGRPEPGLRGLAAWPELGRELPDDLAAELVRDLAAVGLLVPVAVDGPEGWPAWTDAETWNPVAPPEPTAPVPGMLPGLLVETVRTLGPYATEGGR